MAKYLGRISHSEDIANKQYVDDQVQTALSAKDDVNEDVQAHISNTSNPHKVTKSQVGLGSVDNVKQATKAEFDTHNADTTKHITKAERDAWNAKQGNLTAGANVSISGGVISATDTIYDDTTVQSHMSSKTNPHGVTKAQVGLGNVSNIAQASKTEFDSHNSDTTKHITASERNSWNNKQDALGFTAENTSNKGQAGGYAGLDATGRVPVSQLPEGPEGLLNEATGTRLKYWAGSQAEYDAIGTYDLETVYDIW